MKTIRKTLTAILCLALPARLIFRILNIMGHQVHPKSKIGFSMIWLNGFLVLKERSRIGHFNFLANNDVSIGRKGYFGNHNQMKGPFAVVLEEAAAIGNSNKLYRAPLGVTYGDACLRLGVLAKITTRHNIDCTRNISIGNYSTIAGHDSQLWTHAYYQDRLGPGRFRLDGEIEIGNNVNIGSRTVLNCGIKIADGVVVGSNSSVSKSLLKEGTYVSQPLRYMESVENPRSRFRKIDYPELYEEVYERND